MTKIALLVAATMLSAAAVVASPEGPKGMPEIRLMQHQKMMMGDTVIYEADVNLADESRQQYGLEFGVADKTWHFLTLERSANVRLDGVRDGHGSLADGWMVSYVVTDVTAAGAARVEVIYTLRNSATGINKTEHVHADVKIGDRFTATTASGAKVWLIVSRQPS